MEADAKCKITSYINLQLFLVFFRDPLELQVPLEWGVQLVPPAPLVPMETQVRPAPRDGQEMMELMVWMDHMDQL